MQFLQGFEAKIDGRKEALGPGVLGATHACSKLVQGRRLFPDLEYNQASWLARWLADWPSGWLGDSLGARTAADNRQQDDLFRV